MNSSQTALAVLIAAWLVVTLLLSSTQLRVIAYPSPRRRQYVIAWLACSLVAGGLLWATDDAVGRAEWTRRAANFALVAIVSAIGLGAGEWLTRTASWQGMRRPARVLTLVGVHALTVLITAYAFI